MPKKKRTNHQKKVYRLARQVQREAGGKDNLTLSASRRAVERRSGAKGAAPKASPRKPPPDAYSKATGDFGRQLADAILSYATPIFWSAGQTVGRMDDKVRSGTTFFVDTGEALFGVTAGHVYEAHKARADATGVLCQIGLGEAVEGRSRLFDLRDRVIAHSQSPDIATYRISLDEIARTGARVLKATEWPPNPPKGGAGVAFVGYPRFGREIVAPGRIAWDNFHGTALVESVSDEKISCPIPRESIVPIKGMRFPAPGEDTAGLSGGPLVCFNQGAVLSWRLVGVICDGGGGDHKGEGGPFLDMIVAGRADLINADGTINELPLPRRRTPR
jgi:hypothetical protein